MRKHYSTFCIFTTFLFCCCFHACVQEDRFTKNDILGKFFNTSDVDADVCWIMEHLRLKNDSSEFVHAFVERYGYPLWENTYKFCEGESLVYVVPVRSTVPDSEINSIWFFSMGRYYTSYRIYTRDMAENITTRVGGDGVEDTWMFDYFTIHALHKKPASGIFFVSDAATRGIGEIVKCVHAYAGYEGHEADKGWHCWVADYIITGNDPEENFGGGGGFHSGYENLEDMSSMRLDDGGGGGTPSQNPKDGDRSPCSAARELSGNAALKTKLCDLFNAVQNYSAGDTENGWIKTTAGQYIAPSERTVKSIKYSASSLSGQKITEEYHSHPAGGCIPSFQDLQALATRYKNGQIDVANFSYGVVSSMGCFTMVITSEDAFKGFAEKILYDSGIEDAYEIMHAIKNTHGVDTAVAKFIDYLKEFVSGLDVLFSAASYDNNGDAALSNWQAKDSNGSANLSNYNCN
ncbi:hypothetical protein [uncultured Bacteroides sp.]|uniref:hypothetical protein n=1 Tax=uncultured Bacteroides sp. TaxID=162156 RepID=UPI0025F1141E|nr:hypothetical protein [uncultured Bacteroides sp.]